MPRPGEVTPRAAAGSDHGADAQLKRLATAVAVDATRGSGAQPQPPTPGPTASPQAAQAAAQDLNDGYDNALFAPTQRPTEPITSGAPFGTGPNFVPRPFEDDRSFALRVAGELEASPSARDLAPFIQKLKDGR